MPGKQGKTNKPALDHIFHPETIAIAGVSDDTAGFNAGKNFLNILLDAGYKGKIYPLNPKGGKVSGLEIYTSLKDIPGSVDYVISAVPARYTPELMVDCIAKKVKLVHFFSAGFSESGEEEGKQLELQIAAMARQGGVRITGPNGMGLYCPETGLTFTQSLPAESGPFGLLSQSGGNSTYIIRESGSRGLYFSKVVSYGNAADLNETDFLEYFGDDPETEIIGAYIEGVRDGRRFARVLREVASKKPVIVFKSGITEAGGRTAASHTGAIAGAEKTWDSLLKQAGAIRVYSLDELVDTALIFRLMSPPGGKNIAVVGFGGGTGVQAADACSNNGLDTPMLPLEIRQKLKAIWSTEAGSSFKNPVDLFGGTGQKGMELTIKTIAEWEQANLMLIHVPVYINPNAGKQMLKSYTTTLLNLAPQINKRTAVVLNTVFTEQSGAVMAEAWSTLHKAGFPIFPSVERAINAIGRFVRYDESS